MQASVLIMTDVSVVLLLGSLVRAGEHIQQLLSINNIELCFLFTILNSASCLHNADDFNVVIRCLSKRGGREVKTPAL